MSDAPTSPIQPGDRLQRCAHDRCCSSCAGQPDGLQGSSAGAPRSGRGRGAHPELQLLEAVVLGGVEAAERRLAAVVVHAAQALELLGARSVPHRQLDALPAPHLHLQAPAHFDNRTVGIAMMRWLDELSACTPHSRACVFSWCAGANVGPPLSPICMAKPHSRIIEPVFRVCKTHHK